MYFTSKLAGLLMTIAVSTMSAQALAAVPRNTEAQQAQLSVAFFDQPNFGGTSFSPLDPQEGIPNNLPAEWTNRARSLIISEGFLCLFFELPDGQGTPTILINSLNPTLPAAIDQKIDSFTCSKSQ